MISYLHFHRRKTTNWRKIHFFNEITEQSKFKLFTRNGLASQSHDSAFDPRLKKRSVKRPGIFRLISANISLFITEQITFILPIWLVMMHLDLFIGRRKERLHVNSKFAHVMKSDLRFPLKLAYNEQTAFCTPRNTPLQFLSLTEILV